MFVVKKKRENQEYPTQIQMVAPQKYRQETLLQAENPKYNQAIRTQKIRILCQVLLRYQKRNCSVNNSYLFVNNNRSNKSTCSNLKFHFISNCSPFWFQQK